MNSYKTFHDFGYTAKPQQHYYNVPPIVNWTTPPIPSIQDQMEEDYFKNMNRKKKSSKKKLMKKAVLSGLLNSNLATKYVQKDPRLTGSGRKRSKLYRFKSKSRKQKRSRKLKNM
jgi:hypothetical protein